MIADTSVWKRNGDWLVVPAGLSWIQEGNCARIGDDARMCLLQSAIAIAKLRGWRHE